MQTQMAPQTHKDTETLWPGEWNLPPHPQPHPTPNLTLPPTLFLFTNTSSEAPGLRHLSHQEPTDLVQELDL